MTDGEVTMEQLLQDIREWSSRMGDVRYIAGTLTQDLDNLAYDVRRRAPISTGQLKNSIQLLVNEEGGDLVVKFVMAEYGLFQNYGVAGTKNIFAGTQAPDYRWGVPGSGPGGVYAFDNQKKGIHPDAGFDARSSVNIHRFGIKPKHFFIYDDIVRRVNQIINSGFTEITEE